MKHYLPAVLLAFEIFLVVVLFGIIIFLNNANKEMAVELTRPRFGTLSANQRNALIRDLESRRPANLESWADYFRHTLDLETSLAATSGDLDDVFALYQKNEQPARSNYFVNLLITIGESQRATGMTKKTLLGYLGEPEKTQTNRDVEKLFYYYTSFGGRSALAIVNLTNGSVSDVQMGLH